jgi:plastocyanin
MRSSLLMLTAMLLLLGCIPLSTPGATGNNVYVANFFFTPVQDTAQTDVNNTATITFRWADSMSAGHRIVWDSVNGGDGSVPPGNDLQFSGTYEVNIGVGHYYYHCSVHGGALNDFGMDGQIVVLPFGYTPGQTGQKVQDSHSSPVPALVTRPNPAAAPESPRRVAPRSQPATS